SAGERAATALGAAMVHNPLVLLLDSSFSALPDIMVRRVMAHLRDRQGQDGITVVFTTISGETAERADRVALLDKGRLLGFGSPEQLKDGAGADTIVVEAVRPEAVHRTLRGLFDVQVTPTPGGVRLSAPDGLAAAAHLLRHPV